MKRRSPVICLLGHIDHGKTTLLDCIRGTAIAASEPGQITQHLGCTEIPLSVIKKICGELIEKLKVKLTIPGVITIDSPGHEAFANLRRRGGSIADIAILVIDVNQGFQTQTWEAIEILKQFKVPFLVAATKIDLIPGWIARETSSFGESLGAQREEVKKELGGRIYRIVGELAKAGFSSERFDKVMDYRKQVAIVPTSGVTGEGIAELLMVLVGLAQRYLEEELRIEVKGPAKGTIFEVKEEKGLGKTIDVLIYEGSLREGDKVVIGGIREAIVTKVRAILKPSPLMEIRERARFQKVSEVSAAAGVKIVARGLERAIAGMPLRAVWKSEDLEGVKKEVQAEVGEVLIETQKKGLIVKADTLGTLEALVGMLRKKGWDVKKAEIGEVNKSDLVAAEEMLQVDPLLGAVIAFNVKLHPEARDYARTSRVKLIQGNVIYKIVEDYEFWREKAIEEEKRRELERVTIPTKLRFLPGYVFRQSKPAIVGVEVLAGKLKAGYRMMKESGKVVGRVKEIQEMGKKLESAGVGKQVAISIEGAVVGRNVREGDLLYSDLSQEEFKLLDEKLKKYLSESEVEVLKAIVEIKRRKEPLWGV